MSLYPCFVMKNKRATFSLDLRVNNRRLIVEPHTGGRREYALPLSRQLRYMQVAYRILIDSGRWLVNPALVLEDEYKA